MGNYTTNLVAKNLRCPEKGIFGAYIVDRFKKRNTYLEEAAARLSAIHKDHHVLEVGFGPGIGLKEAYEYIKGGSGRIYGIDLSPWMLDVASRSLAEQIAEGKIDICHGTVTNLPYDSNKFDAVFHCNCYYFWDDHAAATAELFRVLKPHSHMVTTVNMDRMKELGRKGQLKYGSIDALKYMAVLEKAGFVDVHMEHLTSGARKFQAIHAGVGKKIEYQEIR